MRYSRRDPQRTLRRHPQLESFEPRLPFSADLVAVEQDAPPLQQFGVLEETPDFVLSESLDTIGQGVAPLLYDAHQITGVHQVQELGLDGSGQTVVVIDSGVAWDHASLGAGFGDGQKIVGGWDFAEDDADPYDDGPRGFHGTHVTGIIGSEDPIHTGVAPGADIVSLRVFNDAGQGMFSWVEEALQWVHEHQHAFEHPITTVNLSLGASWNAETAPSWGTLEEELAQLEADGMFIAVAAGNSFGAYGEPGLAYPAASSYVTPVASVTDAGAVSSFTQRSDRALFAPGQRIMSTIPDHATTAKDGRIVDFGVATGTSMASPYIAGSALLLRQAMEQAGYDSITQDAIYERLRATADPIYDAATDATYYRVNVWSAVQDISRADDYGSSPATAHSLGTVAQQTSVSGQITTAADRDYFSFVATNAGRVMVQAAGVQPAWDAPRDAVVSGNAWSLDVAAGDTIVFGIGAAQQSSYSIDVQLEQREAGVEDLGRVDLRRLSSVSVAEEQRYRVTTIQDGVLAAGAEAGLEVQWWRDGVQVAAGRGAAQVPAGAQEQWELRVLGRASDVDVTISNQVAVTGNLMTVTGSLEDDHLVWSQEDGVLRVNGLEYEVASKYLRLSGGSGADRLEVHGGRWNATIHADYSQLQHARTGISANSFEQILVQSSGGDVTLIGSDANDALQLDAERATLSSDGYHLETRGSSSVHVLGGGGDDSAQVRDSQANDIVTVRDGYATVQGGYEAILRSFESMHVVADQGGVDRAYFYDSQGADTFIASPQSAAMSLATGQEASAEGFERVYGIANGQQDRALLEDSEGDDRLTARPEQAYLRGEGYYLDASGFSVVEVTSVGGHDKATFYDAAGDDRFTAMPGYAVMRGDDFRNVARGFQWVAGFATAGGDDTVNLYDGRGNDHLVISSFGLRLEGDGYVIGARRFETLRGQSLNGGVDTATIVDDWEQADQRGGRTELASDWSTGEARGFLVATPLHLQLMAAPNSDAISALPVVDSSGVDQTSVHQRHVAVFSTESSLDCTDQVADLLTHSSAERQQNHREQAFAADELWMGTWNVDDLV